jgi:threonine/homoserine efflux transporter RhtA
MYHFDRYNPTQVKYSGERELPVEHSEQSLFTHNMAFNRSIKKTLINITIVINIEYTGILRVAIASLVRRIWYIYATNDSVFR